MRSRWRRSSTRSTHGVTLFDTADAYGFGHNEELLGRFLRGKREQVTIATKFGLVRKQGQLRAPRRQLAGLHPRAARLR
jgi:aryl-alcohol dehydrogenase-like predicted oxidoreductase